MGGEGKLEGAPGKVVALMIGYAAVRQAFEGLRQG